MIYKVLKADVFIPSWNGNKELDKRDQIKVGINHASAIEISRAVAESGGDDLTLNFLLYVKWVKNLIIEDKGKKRDAAPIDLIEIPGLLELYLEVKKYVDSYNAIDKKKLK